MKKEKTILSNVFKLLIGFGITLVGLSAVLYISPYFFKEEIDNGIKEVAKNYIKTEVEFKNIDLSFFKHFPKLTVTLEDSSIKGTSPFGSENLISAKEIALGVDLKSLVGDKIIFNELFINQANIAIKVDSLGRNNFDIMVPSEEVDHKNNSPVGLSLNDIKITSTNFLYEDQSSDINVKLSDFSYDGIIDFTDNKLRLDAETNINEAFLQVDKAIYVKNLPLNGLINTTINLNTLSFDFVENQLELGQFPFSLKGNLQLSDSSKIFDIEIKSDQNDLKYIPAIIPEAYQEWAKDIEMQGSAKLLFAMKGIMNSQTNQNPTVHIETTIANGSINYRKSNSPITQLNLVSEIDLPALDPEKLRVKVDNLDFKILDGFTKTNFTYWAGRTMYTEGEISSKLDLEALKNAIGFGQIDTKGKIVLDGNWKGSIVNSVKNSIQKIPSFNLKTKLENVYLKLNEMPAALEHINLDMELANKDGNYKNTSINIHQIDAKALGNYIEGKIKVQNLKNYPIDADFKAKIRLEDIYKIYPLDGITLRGDLFVQMKASGTYDPNHKKVPISNSVIIVKNGYLKYDDLPDLPLENIDVETYIKSGRGSFNDLSIKVLPISFTLAGKPFMVNADVKDLNHLDYRIHSKGKLKLGDFYKLFPIEGLDVDGVITADVGLKGKNGAALENLQNRGFVKLENITIETKYFPSKFKIKEGLFKFNGSQLIFENVKTRYKRNAFVFDGKVSNYMNFALKENELLTGEVNFKTDKININDFMAFSSGETTATSSTSDGVVLLPKNVSIKMNGQAKKILFNDLVLENFKGNLNLDKGNLVLNETQFGLVGSSFNLQGAYQPIHAKKAKFSFDIKGNNFDIQRAYKEIALFREMVSAAEKAHGQISLTYHLEGDLGADMFPKLKTIKGEGDLTAENVQFMGFKMFNSIAEKTSKDALHDANLKNVKLHTSIQNNVMSIDRTKFKIAGFRPRIEGQVTLDGYMNIGMRLGLPPFGIIGIPIKITGPADTFEVEVGKYHKEELEESDEEFSSYQKSLEEEQTSSIQQ